MKLDVDVGDKHKPKYIPLHGKERFNADLWKEPVGWLHRLVTTPEEYRGPRRIVDKSKLNKLCNQEMFRAPSLLKLTKQIPTKVWRSATDAWEGFHSGWIAEEDSHVTVFKKESIQDNYNRTDLRLVFGRVNHVSHYSPVLLSWKSKFYGNKEPQSVVEQAKKDSITAIRRIVGTHSQDRRTVLRTHSSEVGIQYFTYKTRWEYEARIPGCCEDGWPVAPAGSGFFKWAAQINDKKRFAEVFERGVYNYKLQKNADSPRAPIGYYGHLKGGCTLLPN